MNQESEWLFEAPFPSREAFEGHSYSNQEDESEWLFEVPYSNSKYGSNFEQESPLLEGEYMSGRSTPGGGGQERQNPLHRLANRLRPRRQEQQRTASPPPVASAPPVIPPVRTLSPMTPSSPPPYQPSEEMIRNQQIQQQAQRLRDAPTPSSPPPYPGIIGSQQVQQRDERLRDERLRGMGRSPSMEEEYARARRDQMRPPTPRERTPSPPSPYRPPTPPLWQRRGRSQPSQLHPPRQGQPLPSSSRSRSPQARPQSPRR